MTDHDPEFADDLLHGVEVIAQFLFGDRKLRWKVYHLVATSNLSTFKLGSTICARKSVLLKWMKDQEDHHNNDSCKQAQERGKNVMQNVKHSKS
jgi:hypothetical protein